MTASSEAPDRPAANVMNGYVRDVPGASPMHWSGAMESGGAWIELGWDTPQSVSQVQNLFGFRLSPAVDAFGAIEHAQEPGGGGAARTGKGLCGAGVGRDGGYDMVGGATGNYLRLRRHAFAVGTRGVRIRIDAVHGEDTQILRCGATGEGPRCGAPETALPRWALVTRVDPCRVMRAGGAVTG